MSIRSRLAMLDLRTTRRLRRLLHRLARLVPTSRFRSLPFGVNVVGHSDSPHSLGVVTRSVCAALTAAGIPHDLISIDALSFRRGRSFIDASTGARTRPRYAFTLITAWPDRRDLRVISPRAFGGRYVIGQWLWEQSALSPAFINGLDLVDEVWTGSTFAADTFSRSTAKPVIHIPHSVDRATRPGDTDTRTRFGIPHGPTCFLTIAGAGSSLQRKNPAGTLHAFRSAFPVGQTDAVLVIKLLTEKGLGAAQLSDKERFLADPAFDADVIVIDQELADDEVTDLLHACDSFVSLHRAEGFGLGAAEAMSLGRPVIVTDWSGPADYLTPENSFPVPYVLRTILEHDMPHFVNGLEWAEPDLDAAARFMRIVVDDPARAAALGARARRDIMSRYSTPAIGSMMADRLHQLHDR